MSENEKAPVWGLVYQPWQSPYGELIRGFKHIQELCGGYIERVVLDWGPKGAGRVIQLWCNEDAIGLGLPPNVWAEGPAYEGAPILGTAVVLAGQRVHVGTEDEDEEEASLTDEEIQRWSRLPRAVPRRPDL